MALTLLFTLDDDTYGLEIDLIQEIVEDPLFYYAPKARGVLKGAINFHGQILAVIDLPELLGSTKAGRDHRHLVLTQEANSMVLQVNGIEKIVNLDLTFLEPPDEAAEGQAVRGVAEFEELPVRMLDTKQITERLEKTFTE